MAKNPSPPDPKDLPQPGDPGPRGGAREQERKGETPVSGQDPKIPKSKPAEGADPEAEAGTPASSGGKAWRPGDPQPMPGPTEIEQPSAPPLDHTREGAGAWSSPPPGQQAPGDRQPGVPRYADPGRLPRVVNPSDRANKDEGEVRYKVRADIPGEPSRTLYVLAKKGDKQGAVEEYARVCRLTGTRSRMDAEGKVQEANREFDFAIKELAD